MVVERSGVTEQTIAPRDTGHELSRRRVQTSSRRRDHPPPTRWVREYRLRREDRVDPVVGVVERVVRDTARPVGVHTVATRGTAREPVQRRIVELRREAAMRWPRSGRQWCGTRRCRSCPRSRRPATRRSPAANRKPISPENVAVANNVPGRGPQAARVRTGVRRRLVEPHAGDEARGVRRELHAELHVGAARRRCRVWPERSNRTTCTDTPAHRHSVSPGSTRRMRDPYRPSSSR